MVRKIFLSLGITADSYGDNVVYLHLWRVPIYPIMACKTLRDIKIL